MYLPAIIQKMPNRRLAARAYAEEFVGIEEFVVSQSTKPQIHRRIGEFEQRIDLQITSRSSVLQEVSCVTRKKTVIYPCIH
jgi:hypothetical protein